MTTTEETTTATEEVTKTQLGTGGLATVPVVGTLDQLVNLIVDKRETLVNTNQRNVEVFNELQRVTAKITNSLSVLDGAIAGISEFITEETSEDDAHVVRLRELQENKSAAIIKIPSLNNTFLVIGINSKKPIRSVKNPGTISNKAAMAIEAPVIISLIGNLFWYKLIIPVFKVCIPWYFAKYKPIIAVKKIRHTVLKAPTRPPISIIRYISKAETHKKIRKNGFICLI